MMQWIWLGAALAFLIVEVLTVDFFFLMLAAASAGAAIAAFGGLHWGIQVIVFGFIGTLGTVMVRPYIKKMFQPKETPMNVRRYAGKTAQTLTEVTPLSGKILFESEEWTARTEGTTIPAKTTVTVSEVNGAIAIVKE